MGEGTGAVGEGTGAVGEGTGAVGEGTGDALLFNSYYPMKLGIYSNHIYGWNTVANLLRYPWFASIIKSFRTPLSSPRPGVQRALLYPGTDYRTILVFWIKVITQETTFYHINIKYIWGPHVNHMGPLVDNT